MKRSIFIVTALSTALIGFNVSSYAGGDGDLKGIQDEALDIYQDTTVIRGKLNAYNDTPGVNDGRDEKAKLKQDYDDMSRINARAKDLSERTAKDLKKIKDLQDRK